VCSITLQSYQALEKFGQVQEGAVSNAQTLHYDDRGFLVEDEKLLSYNAYRYVYGKDNQPVEKSSYNRTATLVSKELYGYDKGGNRAEEKIFGAGGTLHFKNVLRYDDQNNVVEKSSYESGGALLSRFKYAYNKAGQLLRYTGYRPDGRLMSRYSYRYDEAGNMVQENQFLLNSDDSSFAATTLYYQYTNVDEEGNWTRQIVLNENKIATLVKTRDFEYY
jgi:hypothetical protein